MTQQSSIRADAEPAQVVNSVSADTCRVKSSTGLHALYRKELADNLVSKRSLIILILITATSIASLYGSITGMKAAEEQAEFLFLSLYTTGGNSIPSFTTFIALLGPFVGLSLGFDAINGERNGGTLSRLAAQPIYRDSIIIGKFLAGLTIIVLMVFSMGIAIGSVGVLVTGILPQTEEVLRILAFLALTCVYIAFWLALSIFFSVICTHAATSALAVIAVWIFFTIFMSMVSKVIANVVYPVMSDWDAMVNAYDNYSLNLSLNRLSPYYLYSEAVTTVLNPSVRTVNVVTMQQLDGAVTGYLTFGQSLLLVWPHLVGMIALMLLTFAGAYIGFMVQEIRNR